jgi:hypothetical protein
MHSVWGWFAGKKPQIRQRATRRLAPELLEDRNLMSVAPLAGLADLSLADYLTQDHQMGPIAPAEVAGGIDDLTSVAASYPLTQLLLSSGAEGEDTTTTDPTATDPTTTDPTATDPTATDPTTTDPTTTDPTTTDPTTTDPATTDPTATDPTTTDPNSAPSISNVQVNKNDSTIMVTGSIADNTVLSGLTMTLDNGAAGDVQVNDNGTFTLSVSTPDVYTSYTITALDADGNTTTYTFNYEP